MPYDTEPLFPQGRRRGQGSLYEVRDETHLSAIEDSACAHAWFSRAHEDGGRSQGPVGAARQRACAPFCLTHDPAFAPARRTLAHRYRLRGVGAFEAVFRTGERHDAHFLQLIAAPAAQSPGRVGYVIGRKTMRRAVDRNRLRRRLRENVRASRPAIEAFDIILRVKRTVLRDDIAAANAESLRLLTRLVPAR